MNESLIGDVPKHWEVTTLGEVCQRGGGSIQTGPFGSQLHASDYVPVGVPSIMPVNIGDNRIIKNGIACVTEEDANRLSQHRVREGDIVYSRRGDVERRALVRKPENGWLCGTGCLKVRLGSGVVPEFAAFQLGHPAIRQWIVQHAVGATMPNLNTGIMSAVPLVVPPVPEQEAIARILGTLDDKIELNQRMNTTLEAMARALFQSWFVDFDPVRAKTEGRMPENLDEATAALFPNRFEDSEFGPIPQGWMASFLGDVVEVFDSKRVPLSGRERAKRRGPYPYYGAASVMDHVDDFIFDGIYTLMGEDGSVINGDGAPVLQYVWGKFWVNNHAHVLRGKQGVSTEHILLHLKSVNITPFVTGAVQPKLNQGNINRIPFILPSPQVAEAFSRTIEPIFAQIRANTDQSRVLTAIRDTLLPELLSGNLSTFAKT